MKQRKKKRTTAPADTVPGVVVQNCQFIAEAARVPEAAIPVLASLAEAINNNAIAIQKIVDAMKGAPGVMEYGIRIGSKRPTPIAVPNNVSVRGNEP